MRVAHELLDALMVREYRTRDVTPAEREAYRLERDRREALARDARERSRVEYEKIAAQMREARSLRRAENYRKRYPNGRP